MPASGEGRNADLVAAPCCPQAHDARPADLSAAAAHALAESTLHEHGAAGCAAATHLALEGLQAQLCDHQTCQEHGTVRQRITNALIHMLCAPLDASLIAWLAFAQKLSA